MVRKEIKSLKTITIIALFGIVATGGSALAQEKGNAEAGKAVFAKSCKSCHGPDGSGNANLAKMLKVTIPDLRSKEVQSKSDKELGKAIAEGTGKMKPVKNLSDKDVHDVVASIRTLEKR